MRTLEFVVSGMGCRRCVREVTALLRDLPGVDTVTANIATSVVRLTGAMSIADVLSKFEDTGYAVQLVESPCSAG